jgi:hypothetical protein
MSRLPRHAFAALTLCGLAAAPLAFADAAPGFSSLPSVTLPAAAGKLGDLPKHIPKTESVEGFYLRMPTYLKEAMKDPLQRKQMLRQDISVAQLSVSQAAADAVEQGNRVQNNHTCFTTSEQNGRQGDLVWSGSSEAMATLTWTPNKAEASYYLAPVRPVRSERLDVSDKAHPKLIVTTVLVDAETHGVRLISRDEHALSKIQDGPGDLVVYGARDHNVVELVVESGGARITLQDATGNFMSAGCHHATARLEAKSQGSAEMVGFLQEVALGPAPADDRDSSSMLDHIVDRVRARGGDAQAMRVRPLRLSASLSQLGRDKQPVLSLSSHWVDKERVEVR